MRCIPAAHLRCSALLRCAGCDRLLRGQVRCAECDHWMQKRKADGHRVCRPCRDAADKENDPSAARSGMAHAATQTRSRAKRPLEDLAPTQRRVRRKELCAELEKQGCPAAALLPSVSVPAAAVLHLSRSTRARVRTVAGLHLPCEASIISEKLRQAEERGTRTLCFERGAYVADPLRLLKHAAGQTEFLAVGGDTGGGHTKLGFTYQTAAHTLKFAAVLVYDGTDSWPELLRLSTASLTPFSGDSAGFASVWAFLQYLISAKGAYLHGDWVFLSAVLGLMGPASNYPCPICIVPKEKLLQCFPLRHGGEPHGAYSTSRQPLLKCPALRIVPAPLHVFLGLGNRILNRAYKPLLGTAAVTSALSKVKTLHSPGKGGLSDLYDLSGPELAKWIKKDCCAMVRSAADTPAGQSKAVQARMVEASRWLRLLHQRLLSSAKWHPEDHLTMKGLVTSIYAGWSRVTGDHPFPKLHLLLHAVAFARKHGFLGLASEAPIEAFHAVFNRLFHDRFFNLANQTAERLRSCLAETSLLAVQPAVLADLARTPAQPPARLTRSHSCPVP